MTKTCMNCAYRLGSFSMGKCLQTGNFPDLQRKYLQGAACDINFSGWAQRRPLLTRIAVAVVGERQESGNGLA